MVVKLDIPLGSTSFCWSRWHAYISTKSLTATTPFPDFTTKWMTGLYTGSTCGVGATTIELCPGGTATGAWTLPSCGASMFTAFRLTMADGRFAWLNPQVPLANNQFDGDGITSRAQSCPGECYSLTGVKVNNPSSVQGGTASFKIDGNYLKVEFSVASGYVLTGINVYVGNTVPVTNIALWPFRYTVGGT